MERRVFIAIVLSFLVLYMYQAYFAPPPAPRAAASAAPAPTAAGVGAGAGPVKAPTSTSAQATAAVPAGAPQPQALVSEPAERQITVDTATVQAVLTNRGGRLLHWRLKQYRDDRGDPVDLVPAGLPPGEQVPFSLRLDQPDLTTRLNDTLYRVTGDANGHVDATRGPASVSFDYQDAAGLRVRKAFAFDPSDYIVALTVNATNGNSPINPTIVWGPGPGDIVPSPANPGFLNRTSVPPPELILHRAGKVERIAMTKLPEQPIQEGQFRFAGVEDHYFLIAAVNPGQARLETRALVVPGPSDTRRQLISHAIRFPQPPMNARFFVGPKEFDLLRSVDEQVYGNDAILRRAVNFGFFQFLAVPLLGGLKWLHGIVGNWGWSIVLLTVLINLAMFPLRHKSVVSMRRMQELQPQLKAIQDRYANLKVTDPGKQKMNTEVMNLYREKGVNPASGCVPMLLMMPVLFAFYSLLGQSIELRGAQFGWWIMDLSRPDPFYVIPLLVIGSQIVMQRLTPNTSMDPAQQRMMTFMMPIMFGFIFMTSAAGTALYWLVSNLWAIGQQYFTNWMIGPPMVPAPRPAAERRLKNAGGGRTAGAEKQP
jgi:YidC/Oxa1 family membrane protein insertase